MSNRDHVLSLLFPEIKASFFHSSVSAIRAQSQLVLIELVICSQIRVSNCGTMDEQQDDSNSQTELRIDTDANDSFSDGETSSPSEHEEEPTLPVLVDQREMLTPSPESDSNYALVIKDGSEKTCSGDDVDELEGQETNASEETQPSTKLTDSHDLIRTLTDDDDDLDKTADDSEVQSPPSSDAEFELSVQLNEEPTEIDLTENLDKRSTGQSALLDGDNEEPGTVKIELIEDNDLEKPDSLKNELTEDSGSEDPEQPANVDTLSSVPTEKLYDDEVLRDNDDIKTETEHETGYSEQSSDDESNFGEEVKNIPHDTSDEGSDFAGFDSVSAEKTAEIIESRIWFILPVFYRPVLTLLIFNAATGFKLTYSGWY